MMAARLLSYAAKLTTLVTVVAGGLGCSARTLIAVGPCLDGSASTDGSVCSLRSGLIGLWHFDETPGATIAADASGLGNDGTLMGKLDPKTAWVVNGGRAGNALAVQALGYVVVRPSTSVSSITSAVTVSAWVYFDGTIDPGNNYGTALSRQIGTSINQYYHLAVWQTDAKPHLFISTAPEGSVTVQTAGVQPMSSVPTPPKVWTHLAGTYDGTTATLYVGGALVDSVPRTGTFPTDTTPLILGGNGNDQMVSELFPGRIDEIALYNRALDAAEIQQLANAVSF
jgi:Concanavalin A-like lectin/glucanases superfamily